MELWELIARESIRDLVTRYNANGDTGRLAQVMELFAEDAVMVLEGSTKTGHDEIRTIFTGANEAFAPPPPGEQPLTHVRHHTATLQIDLVDENSAKGRCYFQVLTDCGLDHWGRYVDEYKRVEGAWRFARRTVTVDGQSPDSLFMRGR